jgi:hypothetical protein
LIELAGEGLGDGRQPQITCVCIRGTRRCSVGWMTIPQGKLYGPYHGGRSYFLWMVRGSICASHWRPIAGRMDILDDHVRTFSRGAFAL